MRESLCLHGGIGVRISSLSLSFFFSVVFFSPVGVLPPPWQHRGGGGGREGKTDPLALFPLCCFLVVMHASMSCHHDGLRALYRDKRAGDLSVSYRTETTRGFSSRWGWLAVVTLLCILCFVSIWVAGKQPAQAMHGQKRCMRV